MNLTNFFKQNSTLIFTGTAVVGVLAVAVTASMNTMKANDVLEELDNRGDNLSRKDKFFKIAPCYIPTVIVSATTIASIIASYRTGDMRAMAYSTALTTAESAFSRYREQVQKTLGKEGAEKVDKEIAKQQIYKMDKPESLIISGNGNVLCLDSYSGRYFSSNSVEIQKIINSCNQRRMADDWVSLNDLYDKLGLEPVSNGDFIGWTSGNEIGIQYTTQLNKDNQPVLVLNYSVQPDKDYYSKC